MLSLISFPPLGFFRSIFRVYDSIYQEGFNYSFFSMALKTFQLSTFLNLRGILHLRQDNDNVGLAFSFIIKLLMGTLASVVNCSVSCCRTSSNLCTPPGLASPVWYVKTIFRLDRCSCKFTVFQGMGRLQRPPQPTLGESIETSWAGPAVLSFSWQLNKILPASVPR